MKDNSIKKFLIVGLGNPEKKFSNTRHNIGFLALDAWVKKYYPEKIFSSEKKIDGLLLKIKIPQGKLFLLKPETFMNLSGIAVQKTIDFYQIQKENVLVIFDDIDLSFGKIRFSQNGRSGGHKGLQSIIDFLETTEINRLKIGIDNRLAPISTEKYVLENFDQKEREYLEKMIFPAVIDEVDNFIAKTGKSKKTINLKINN